MDKGLRKNFLFNFFYKCLGVIFPAVSFSYISRILGVSNLGKVQYCNSLISYFTLISSLGIGIYAVREGAKYKDDKYRLSKFTKEMLIINSLSMLISYFLMYIFISFFLDKEYHVLFIILSLNILFSVYSVDWLYQITEEFRYISIRAFIIRIVSLIIILFVVRNEDDYIKYAIVTVSTGLGNFLLNIIYSKKYIKWNQRMDVDVKKHIKPILIIFGISVASSIYMEMDTVMLGRMKGDYAVGLYSAAVKIIQIVKILINSISNVLFTRLSFYIAQKRYAEYNKLLKIGVRFVIMLSIPSALGMCMLSENIIKIFSGNAYIQASFAGKVLAINCFFSIVDGIMYYQVMLPFKKEMQACVCTIIGAIVNLLLNIYFINMYSYNGAAVTTLFAELCVFGGLCFCTRKHMKISLLLKYICIYMIYSLPIMLVCFVMNIYFGIGISMLCSIVISVILYGITLIVMKDKLCLYLLNNMRYNKE